MYCGNCGHQMKDGEKFCTNCGFENKQKEKKEEVKEEVIEVKPSNDNKPVVQNNNQEPTPIVGIFALIFTFLFSPVGLVLGIIAIVKGKEVKANKVLGIVSTILSTLSILLGIVIISILIAAYSTTVDRIDDYRDDYRDYVDSISDIEKKIQGNWTCTLASGESMDISFNEDNEFNATHKADKIEGTYYAYQGSDKNTATIYLYYTDDGKSTSNTANFMIQSNIKAIMTIDNDTIFNCLRNN